MVKPHRRNSWVYAMNKKELADLCRELGLEASGSVDDMRKLIVGFIPNIVEGSEVDQKLETFATPFLSRSSSPSNPREGIIPKVVLSTALISAETGLENPQTKVVFSTVPTTTGLGSGLHRHLKSDPQEQEMQESLMSTEEGSAAISSGPPKEAGSPTPSGSPKEAGPPTSSGPPKEAGPLASSYGAIMTALQRWNIRYDGSPDILLFLERVEELAEAHAIPMDKIPQAMPELLTGRALSWYRFTPKPWASWNRFKDEFLKFFLSSQYMEQLKSRIAHRLQGPKECFKNFVLALHDMMRHANMSEGEKTQMVYRNCRREYQIYMRSPTCTDLQELIRLAEEFEAIHEEPRKREEQYRTAISEDTHVKPLDACRRCGQQGHRRASCVNPIMLFCWICGKKNVRTVECCRAPRTGIQSMNREKPNQPTRVRPNLKCEHGHLLATVDIQGKSYTAIVDTGASRSFIREDLAAVMRAEGRTQEAEVNLRFADGRVQQVKETIELKVDMGNCRVNAAFLILPHALDPLTIGLDFLGAVNCTISLGGECLPIQSYNSPSVETLGQVKSSDKKSYPGKEPTEEEIQNFIDAQLEDASKMTGLCNMAVHQIHMKDTTPIKQRYYPKNPIMQAEINRQVDELISEDCIEPSKSPYSAPVVLTKKSNGKWRMCIDYRQLNAKSEPDAYPLPRINHILDRLRESRFFTSLDLRSGYWQIPVDPESRKFTAFTVPGRGLYQWKVMPFGLHSAPATFQRTLDQVIGPEFDNIAFAYLDDIIVLGETKRDHLENLQKVFDRLKEANLRINPEKCKFFKTHLKYLGHVVSDQGIHTDPEKVAAISNIEPPKNLKELRRFFGVASWYRRFVPNFPELTSHLSPLLKKNTKWKWTEDQQEDFENLKDALTKAPVLTGPDYQEKFVLQTDASGVGLGAVLTQTIKGEERVIAYASRGLNPAEQNYSATEKECLAIVWGIRKMREYLEGYHFTVLTDHLALKWLNSIESPTGRIAKWALELQAFNFDIEYRKGQLNVVADALSRKPIVGEEVACRTAEEEPTCKWVQKMKINVEKFPEKYPDYNVTSLGNLYRHLPRSLDTEEDMPWKLCVPQPLRDRVLLENHTSPCAGHLGIRKTIARISLRYYWPSLYQDVRKFVQSCTSCQKYKANQQKPAGPMLTQIPEEPWAIVCADFVGPLPRSTHGNTMLLVFVDKFSKWVELIPLRAATTATLQKALRERILSRFGVPKVLVTDNGTQFTSHGFRKFLDEMGMHHQFTAPYTPQENPTERMNRTVKTMIAQFAEKDHRLWDQFLPEIMLAINSSRSDSTGYSATFITQGREPRLPKALFDEKTLGTGRNNTTTKTKFEEIFEIVKLNLGKAATTQARHYNLRRRSWKPRVGQWVMLKQHHLSKATDNFAAKLAPKFDGPYQILDFMSPVIVKLQSGDGKTLKTAHIQQLKEVLEEVKGKFEEKQIQINE